jgi:predicted dehydrogenase
MGKYRCAVIGCGPMGVANMLEDLPFTYSFAGAVRHTGNELVAVADIDKAVAENWGNMLHVPAYLNFPEMLDKEKPDIVCCAAGPLVNYAAIKEAVKRKIKGVYCEKPLVLSLKEADELAKIEKKSKTKMQVNYLRNYDTCHNAVIDYIKNDGIGNLQAVRTTYNGGVMSVFPHTTALLSKLFDRAISVSGVYSPIQNISTRTDPNIDGVIRYHFSPQNRDVTAQILATGRGKDEDNTYIYELEFTGSKSRISIKENGWRVEYEQMLPSRVFKGYETHPYRVDRVPIELKADAPREFMLEGLQKLIYAIETGTSTECSLSRSRNAEEISHALAISAAKGGKTVYLPLKNRNHSFESAKAGINVLREQAGQK